MCGRNDCPPSLVVLLTSAQGLSTELAAKGGCQIWVVSTGTQDLSNALLLSAYVQVYLNEKLKIEHCPRVSLPMNLNKYKQGT